MCPLEAARACLWSQFPALPQANLTSASQVAAESAEAGPKSIHKCSWASGLPTRMKMVS